jgi:hypothetical protein
VRTRGVEVLVCQASKVEEIAGAIAAKKSGADALNVLSSGILFNGRGREVDAGRREGQLLRQRGFAVGESRHVADPWHVLEWCATLAVFDHQVTLSLTSALTL